MTLKEKLLLLELVIDNEYLDKYCELIENNRNTKKEKFKTQKHHIIPKYYYKENKLELDNSKDNLVNLYYKNHILAHYYLCLCSKTTKHVYHNFITIRYVYNNRWLDAKGFDLNSLDKYQELYEQSKKYQSELELGKHTKPATDKRKQKIGDANRNRKYIYKDDTLKFVKQDELDEYLKQGWRLGNPKMSEAKKGKTPWNKGKTSPLKGISRPQSVINKMINNSTRKKKIICINNEKIYNSLNDASRELGISSKGISRVCTGCRKQYKGYKFRYYIN